MRRKRRWRTWFGSSRAGRTRTYGFTVAAAFLAVGCHCPGCSERDIHGNFKIQGPSTVTAGHPVTFTIDEDSVVMPEDSADGHNQRDLYGDCPTRLTWWVDGNKTAAADKQPPKTRQATVCTVDNETLTVTFPPGARTTTVTAKLMITEQHRKCLEYDLVGALFHGCKKEGDFEEHFQNDSVATHQVTVQNPAGGGSGGVGGRPVAVDVAPYEVAGGAPAQDDVAAAHDLVDPAATDFVNFHPSLAGGTLGSPTTASLSAGVDPTDLASGLVNLDTSLDAVVTEQIRGNAVGADDQVQVVGKNGSGVFGLRATETVGASPMGLDLGDLNNDGSPDLAVAAADDNQVNVLRNDPPSPPAADFTTRTDIASGGSLPHSVAIADFNADGKRDIAVANTDGGPITALRNTTAGALPTDPITFAAAEPIFAAGNPDPNHALDGPRDLVTGDFNEDGKQDIAYVDMDLDRAKILLNNTTVATDLEFTPGMTLSASGMDEPVSIHVGDFNNDANLDLVMANRLSDDLMATLGNGNGTFGAPTTLAAGDEPRSVAAGRLDGDARDDVVAANTGSGSLTVHLSGAISPMLGTAGTTAEGLGSLAESAATARWYEPGPRALAAAKGAKAVGRFVQHELVSSGNAVFLPGGGMDLEGMVFAGKLKLKVKGGKGIDLGKTKLRVIAEMNGRDVLGPEEIPPPLGDGVFAAKGKKGTKLCGRIEVNARDTELETLRITGGAGAARGLRGRGQFAMPNLSGLTAGLLPPDKLSMKVKTKGGGGRISKDCSRLLKSL